MSVVAESWDSTAHTLGFEDTDQMLEYLYGQQSMSLRDIARLVDHSVWSVRRRLAGLGIMLNKRGGPNHRGKRKLAHLTYEELAADPQVVARQRGVHLSTVYAERRVREWQALRT